MGSLPKTTPITVTPHKISTWHRYMASAAAYRASGASAATGSVTWVANSAVYIPFHLPFSYNINRLYWINGGTITSTNVDVGIYSNTGEKIVSIGPTAMSGASSIQFASISGTKIIQPGSYYIAWWCNGTTSRAHGVATAAQYARTCGILRQDSLTSGLPDVMTPIAYAPLGIPIVGFTRTLTGF